MATGTIQNVKRYGYERWYNLPRMEKVLQVFNSFAEAEAADRKYYQSLTPTQRIEILLVLRSMVKRNDDEPRGRLKRVYRVIKRS